jgi:hypothetical protein
LCGLALILHDFFKSKDKYMKNWIPLFLLLLALSSCKTRNGAKNDTTNTRDSIRTAEDNRNPKDVNEPVRDKFTFFEHVVVPPKFDQIKIDSKVRVETGSYVPTWMPPSILKTTKRYG